MDRFWDEEVGLLRDPGSKLYGDLPSFPNPHVVRETIWYALGLLMREGPGDRHRAHQAIRTVLAHQFNAPGQPYHGTWMRAPEEPPLPRDPHPGPDYDPNWREFVGTTLAVLLLGHERRLSRRLVGAMDAALYEAVVGAYHREVPASYTNIALMRAFLFDFAAHRFAEPRWALAGEALAAEIHDLFNPFGTFSEYNSPTYYGVDLHALALLRSHARSPVLRGLGSDMEERLCRDIASFYHAGLANLCGPYFRSYGMDMRRYASVLGMWIWRVLGRARAPFPDIEKPFAHARDFCYGPCLSSVEAPVPPEVLRHLMTFQGERLIERRIDGLAPRTATAWLSSSVMLGGADMGNLETKDSQFHAATVHWRTPDGSVGSIRLLPYGAVVARAERGRLVVDVPIRSEAAEVIFRVAAPVADAEAIRAGYWKLPGLSVRVDTGARWLAATRAAEHLDVRYAVPAEARGQELRFVLSIIPTYASSQSLHEGSEDIEEGTS